MKHAYKALGAGLGLYLLFAPANSEAFYVSQEEQNKAGISIKDKQGELRLGKNASYKGKVEKNESFQDIARRVNKGAEKDFTIKLSEKMTEEILAEFNNYNGIEMPFVSVLCKGQYLIRLMKKTQKEIDEQKKSGYAGKEDIEFLEKQLRKLDELYNSEITDIKTRMDGLENKPEQKDYSPDIEELREMIKGLESKPGQKDYSSRIEKLEEIIKELESREYAQPPVTEGGEYGQPPVEVNPGEPGVIYGQQGWFPGLPGPYIIMNGAIYGGRYVGGTFFGTYWGPLDIFGDDFYAWGPYGRIRYHGPRDMSLLNDFRRHHDAFHGKNSREIPRHLEHRRGGHPDNRFGSRGSPGRELAPRSHGREPLRAIPPHPPSRRDNIFEGSHGRGTLPKVHMPPQRQQGFPNQQPNYGMQNRGHSGMPPGGVQQRMIPGGQHPNSNQQSNRGMQFRGPQGSPPAGHNFQGGGQPHMNTGPGAGHGGRGIPNPQQYRMKK